MKTLDDTHSTDPSGAAPPRLGRWLWTIIIVLVIALVAGGVPRLLRRRELIAENKQSVIPTVNVVSALPGTAGSTLSLPAEVRPMVEAPIYARANGFVKKWTTDLGATVRAGELLAEIDAPELEQELRGAKAQTVQAQAALALSRTTAARWAELLKTSSVSEQEAAEKKSDLALKEATVELAEANVRRLQDLQSFTSLKAPFDGTITARLIDVGDLITSGKELFRLADLRKLRVFVRVPQPAAAGISIGLGAELAIAERPEQKFVAKVVRTAGAIDAGSRTMLTELEVDNSRHEILAGSYAEVRFSQLKQQMALVLPSNTLLFRAEGSQVAVVDKEGRVELRNVALGRDFGRTVEIVSGLGLAERVIVNPSDSLVSNMMVRVVVAEDAHEN